MKSINYYTKGKNYCLYPIITAKSFVKIEHIDRRGGSLYIYTLSFALLVQIILYLHP